MTKQQAKFIEDNYREMSYMKIAEEIGSNYHKVRKFCIKKGLKRTSTETFKLRSKARKKATKKVEDNVPHYFKRDYRPFDFI